MSLFAIDPAKCKRDGICVEECPRSIIEMKEGAFPVPTADAEELCIRCGHCVAVCPHGAFTHAWLNSSEFPQVRKDFAIEFDQAEHFLRSRRSIRAYKDKPVEREKLTMLIGAARHAPTGTNSQLVHWKVIDSREGVRRLGGVAIDMIRDMVEKKNPMAQKYRFATLVADWDEGINDGLTRGAPALVIAHAPKEYGLAQVDCTSALAYFDLMAPTLGLGSCWGGFLMIAASCWPPFQKALGLPEGHASFGMMMVGYPKYKYHLLPPRNEAKITWEE